MAELNASQNSDLESKIVDTLRISPNGVTQSILEKSIPSMSVVELAQVLNKFIAQGKIELLRKKNQLVYALKDKTADKKTAQSADVEERIIYEAVKRAGNNGTTPKDLKFACNLPQPHITKLLKNMENKRLVKSVMSSSKKKVFLLFDLEPSHTVTGGTFYSGQEFETEFVDVLSEQCYRYLLQAKGLAEKLSDPVSERRASFKTSKEICDYINSLKISKVELKVQDIEQILTALIYDAKVEMSISMNCLSVKETGNITNSYRASKPLTSNVGLMRMPCGVCPVYMECGIDQDISPSTCLYLKEWLDF